MTENMLKISSFGEMYSMGFELPDDLTYLGWYDNWLDNDFLKSNCTRQSP